MKGCMWDLMFGVAMWGYIILLGVVLWKMVS